MSESKLESFGTNISSPNNNGVKHKPSQQPTDLASEKEDLINSVSLVQWAVCGPHTYKPVSSTFEKLQSGVYSISVSQYHGVIFQKKNICVDDLLKFPDSLSDKVLNEITTFWKQSKKFLEHGFLHRRGYLFHGPAGSGKTCLVQQIIADIVNNDGLVFQCGNHPSVFNDGLSLFRKVEPNRPVVCLFEDIDATIEQCGEDEILTLLDGENQIDKVLNIATTNYPEKLDKRLVCRPRRFDRVIYIDMPNSDVRRMYFEKKLKVSGVEIDKWVKSSDGFSFAACAELVISVYCFGKPFEEAVTALKEMMNASPNSSKYNHGEDGAVGFANRLK